MQKDILIKENRSNEEYDRRSEFYNLYKECPLPANEQLVNLSLFLKRQDLSAIFFFNEIYQKILNIHGIITEFGVRWGKNLALFQSLRGIYEPFNHNRKIVGFDTFKGFPSVNAKDGNSFVIKQGAYSVTDNYKPYLEKILNYHETESPISHIKKYELVEGDAVNEIENYLKSKPETIIAFAYFDFDIYEPTKKCLEMILPHLTKGSIIGFDELNNRDYPGETLALKEVLGSNKYKIIHSPFSPTQSYIVLD